MFASANSQGNDLLSEDGRCPAVDPARAELQPTSCRMTMCPLLREHGKVRPFDAGEIVFWEGDDTDRYFLVAEGVLRGCKLLSDGRRQISRFLFAGDLLAYSASGQYPYTAEAVTSVTLLALPRAVLEGEAESTPCLRRLLTRSILHELQETQEQVLLLGRMTATERVSHFLTSLARRGALASDDGTIVELPMSRADIADYLGLTIETVSRVLSRFKREGKIRMEGHNRIVLEKMQDLIPAGEVLAA